MLGNHKIITAMHWVFPKARSYAEHLTEWPLFELQQSYNSVIVMAIFFSFSEKDVKIGINLKMNPSLSITILEYFLKKKISYFYRRA